MIGYRTWYCVVDNQEISLGKRLQVNARVTFNYALWNPLRQCNFISSLAEGDIKLYDDWSVNLQSVNPRG